MWDLVGLCARVLLAADSNGTAGDGHGTSSPFAEPPSTPARAAASFAPFRPSMAVVVGVLTTMFSLTFLLLLYAKHCKRNPTGDYSGGANGSSGFGPPSSCERRRNSGVDRAVVDLLPVFRFGALLGEKEGLECAVCLNRFEAAEAVRLLPKCRHGFHVECVDTWLDAHSTCPLCRIRVDPEDVLLLPHLHLGPSTGPTADAKPKDGKPASPFGRRISGRHSSAGERSTSGSLQIVVHRSDQAGPRARRWSDYAGLRAGGGGPPSVAGCFEVGAKVRRKDRLLLTEKDREEFERRYGHRIVVSGGDGIPPPSQEPERWSELRPSDLLFLRSEMIISEGGRLSASRLAGASRASGGRGVSNERSVSEIIGLSRLPDRAAGATRAEEQERMLRRWLGFASKPARGRGRQRERG